ncbi:MAG: LD-carboxypeptidase [Alphaproteobacteria bacterium]|nr:LD-carboxypeptidase [Alphaproteobacteria bacterium]
MTKHISLIAPSYPFPEEDVKQTKHYLESLGMKVSVPADLLGEDLLCANLDTKRLAHLQCALEDPSIDVVWMLRGGYGLTRLLPDLLTMKKPDKEKLFIGFSDGTALHVFLNQMWNWPTLHGAVAIQIAKKKVGAQTLELTLRMLREGFDVPCLLSLKPLNEKAKEFKSLSGVLIGGNLCLIECSLGTPWQIKTSGKILFLEDVSERGYRIDRMLVHLEQARIFEEAKAIIFGDFIEGGEADGSSLVLPVLERFAKKSRVPVFSLPGCGHGDENVPLPFNINLSFSIAHH